MPQHAVRAIDYAGMHLWPDNWKRQDLDFGSGWTRNHSSDAAVLAKPLVLEEFGKARGAPPATPCSRPARLTRPCPGMCACQQTGGWHGLGPCRRLFPCPCQRLPAGIVSGVWRHGRGRAPTLACVADGSTWWLVLTRPARAAAGRGRPQRAGPDGAAAAGLVQAHLRAGRGEHQLGRAAQGAAAPPLGAAAQRVAPMTERIVGSVEGFCRCEQAHHCWQAAGHRLVDFVCGQVAACGTACGARSPARIRPCRLGGGAHAERRPGAARA